MILSIHQPSYWPWLGLLYKIANSDHFVFLEDVAANKASYQYRNIFFCNGEPKFLSLPVNYSMGIKLNELRFKNHFFYEDHLNKLTNYYQKARYLEEGLYIAKKVLDVRFEKPIDLLYESLIVIMGIFNVKTSVHKSSTITYTGVKDDLVLSICEAMHAKVYISGAGGMNYMSDLSKFERKGIEIKFYKFCGFNYPQDKRYPFLMGLSALDIIMFNGIEKSKELFWENFGNNRALKKGGDS